MPSNRIEYMRKYFADNKDKILSRMSEKIMCDNCNCLVVRSHMNRHQKTKRCISAIQNKMIIIKCWPITFFSLYSKDN